MKKYLLMFLFVIVSISLMADEALLSPGDFIMAIDTDGISSSSNYPANESVEKAFDNDFTTKYLNFAGKNSGFAITLESSEIIRSFKIITGNDAPGRDPAEWILFGTNESVISGDNSAGLDENWILVDSGSVKLSPRRYKIGPVVPVNNSKSYNSYKIMFTGLRNNDDILQFQEIFFYNNADGSGEDLTIPGNKAIAVHQGWSSKYPGGEAPQKVIDGDSSTKYLNFGGTNTGLIVVPQKGPTTIKAFEIVTANDAPERDPLEWILYGTNNAIKSVDNSDGSAENWTLISSGEISLPDGRNIPGDKVFIDNDNPFIAYKMIFNSIKNAEANIMQISEIQYYGVK